MNQFLKSLFIGFYPLLCLVGLVIAVDQYIHGFLIAAIGLALISLPMLIFLGSLFLTNIARTDPNLKIYSAIILLGLVLLLYSFNTNDVELMAMIGFAITTCWLLYIRWYSRFGDRSNTALAKGQLLPKITLEDEDGNTVLSNSFLGKKSILMFYRGNWCPLCVTQIKELVDEYKALAAKGIQTILISPQPHGHTKKLAARFDVDFKFLVDQDNTVAKQLNIASEYGLPMGFQVLGYDSDTVLPTIILVDEDGKIIHSDLTSNYRVRPEPSELLGYFN